MAVEDWKARIRRFIEDLWNRGDLAAANEMLAPDVINHNGPPGLPPGRDGYKQFVRMCRAAFPDLHFSVNDILVEEGRIAIRWSARGTHLGAFMGVSATGRQLRLSGVTVVVFEGDKITEIWSTMDLFGLFQQLGTLLELEQARGH